MFAFNNLTHLHRVDSSTTTLWTVLFPIKDFCYYYYVLQKFPVFNANSVDPDQTPRIVASNLCLQFANYPLEERGWGGLPEYMGTAIYDSDSKVHNGIVLFQYYIYNGLRRMNPLDSYQTACY